MFFISMFVMILLIPVRHKRLDCALFCFRRVGTIIIRSGKDRNFS